MKKKTLKSKDINNRESKKKKKNNIKTRHVLFLAFLVMINKSGTRKTEVDSRMQKQPRIYGNKPRYTPSPCISTGKYT